MFQWENVYLFKVHDKFFLNLMSNSARLTFDQIRAKQPTLNDNESSFPIEDGEFARSRFTIKR